MSKSHDPRLISEPPAQTYPYQTPVKLFNINAQSGGNCYPKGTDQKPKGHAAAVLQVNGDHSRKEREEVLDMKAPLFDKFENVSEYLTQQRKIEENQT